MRQLINEVEESPARSPRPQNTKRPNKKKSEQSEADKKICEAILAEIEWRDQLDELCQEFPFQISDFDPKALRLLDEYFAEGALDSAFDALKELKKKKLKKFFGCSKFS